MVVVYIFFINTTNAQDIQRVRIDFETPDGCSRQLLLGFTTNNEATDNFDWGYDGLALDHLPNDLNWIIDNNRYVIQGVGAYDNSKVYPLGLFVTIPGSIKIALNSLENFTEEIDVFIYDSVEETYNKINDNIYENSTEVGDFLDRYFIAFKEPNLSSDDIKENDFSIKYLRNSGELLLDTINDTSELTIYNTLGQITLHQERIRTKRFKINFNYKRNSVYIVKVRTPKGIISKKIII